MKKRSPSANRSFIADSLAAGMLVMLVMTVVQRSIGFLRGIWFCRLLDDSSLGQWSMAFDFVVMVTPIMLLGIPGSLTRYVERYRLGGHLPALVSRLLITTGALGGLFFLVLMLWPSRFAWLVFSNPTHTTMVYGLGFCVVAVVMFNFVHQLVAALRQVRVVSLMQFTQGVAFTLAGVCWLFYGGGIAGLIVAFGLATLTATLPGLVTLRSGWQGLPKTEETFDSPSMWRRLLPYAAALWAMNLLINLFFLSDRYMILHLLPSGAIDGQAAIGQYHSGRILPGFLMSLATMISGVLMPYLAADWEAGRRRRVRDRVHQMLFAVSVLFTAGSAFALWIAPWLFTEVLEDRYRAGLELMPMAFVIAIWFALATIGQDYLWVAERGKLVAIAIGIGLVANIALNLWLLPRWGLTGAVTATLLANGLILLGLWTAMSVNGYRIDISMWHLSLLPGTLLAGPTIAFALAVITAIVSPAMRRWISEGWSTIRARLGVRVAA